MTKEEKPSKINKKLLTLIIVAAIAGGVLLVWKLSVSVPHGATLGGLDCALAETENRHSVSMVEEDEDGRALTTELPLRMYVFRPDGGLVVADYDKERGVFVAYNPSIVYYVKGSTIYYTTTYQYNGTMKPASQWKVLDRFKVVDGQPYIDGTFAQITDYELELTQDQMSWEEFSSRITQANKDR